ncbi:MAG: methyltransferase domain-containing protein [Chloroflexota bacterium]
MTSDTRYDSTRIAWEHIWQQADIDAELETVRSARSLETIRAYQPYLPKDELILEAGSGLSAVVITLRRRGYNVLGLDYAVNALQASHAYDGGLPLAAGDVHKLPFADGSVGAYLSFGVLEHFEHGMGPALSEAARVLRQHGTLVLTIPYPNAVYRLVQLKRALTGQGALNDDDFYESTYTREALEREVTQAGFRVLISQPTSHAFTLWGLGGPFQGNGYYETSPLAEVLGGAARQAAPWAFNFMTLIVARKK